MTKLRLRRTAVWGFVAVAVYLAVAVLSVSTGLLRGRPLYDGLPLEPYRWVTPPSERVKDNKAPMGADKTLKYNASGLTDPGSVSTGDIQATVIFQEADPKEYSPTTESGFKVKVTALDPSTVGPRPAGRYFDSNAYKIEATYPSGAPVTTGKFDIVLTYAVHSTDMRRWNGSAWTKLERPSADRSSLQIYSFSPELGIFVATGDGDVPKEPEGASRPSRPAVIYVVLGLGAAIGTGIAIFSGRKKQPASASGDRPPKAQAAKGKGPPPGT